MAIPGWALGLGAALKAPEVASDYVGLYKSIRDMRHADENEEAARASVENLGWAAQEPDPKVRLENLREVSRDMGGRRLSADTLLRLQKEIDPLAKAATSEVQQQQEDVDIRRFAAEAKAAGKDMFTYGFENPDRAPASVLRKFSITAGEMAGAAKDVLTAREAEAKRDDTAGFRSAISGLTDPSRIPAELKRFASTDGYDPGGERDILAAAADYPRVDPTAVSGAVDDYRLRMTNQPVGKPYPVNTRSGDATHQELRQRFVLGGDKPAGGSVTNHPKQTGAGGTAETRPIRVSWVAADGTANSATVSASELPTLTASLQAQGVKWIDTVDGKRAVSRKTLIPEKKGKSSLLGPRPTGGAAAPAAKGGFTYVNGKLVAN